MMLRSSSSFCLQIYIRGTRSESEAPEQTSSTQTDGGYGVRQRFFSIIQYNTGKYCRLVIRSRVVVIGLFDKCEVLQIICLDFVLMLRYNKTAEDTTHFSLMCDI